jgi:hypothetical protein
LDLSPNKKFLVSPLDASLFCLKETLLTSLKPSQKIQKTEIGASVASLMMPNPSFTPSLLGILFIYIEKQILCVHNWACAFYIDGPISISISSIPNLFGFLKVEMNLTPPLYKLCCVIQIILIHKKDSKKKKKDGLHHIAIFYRNILNLHIYLSCSP